MGCLGSNLDDYYSYQLLDKVIEQIKNNDTGDVNKLSQRLRLATRQLAVKKLVEKNKQEIITSDPVRFL
jgi:hypothetical protein